MKRILLQLDTDPIPSTFDRIVALDAGVDEVISLGGMTPDNVVSVVHGAIFTRKPDDLKNTAIFIGGSAIDATEKVLAAVRQTFLGPMSVSVMVDPNGATTTAAAAVRSVVTHIPIKKADVLVLGATGPVGQRTALILATLGAKVRVSSRNMQRAEAVASSIRNRIEGATVIPCDCSDDGLAAAVDNVDVIISAGAAGAGFLKEPEWQSIETLKVAIDLNAVPPSGLEGIPASAKGIELAGKVAYGPLGVGSLKMKVHKAAIEKLFTANHLILDSQEIYALSENL
ncbi:NAD(P)-dependent methylenetetrahydromethanopterin dehydrogenase [Planctomicrobium sp. SH527]|uniref:NAD(P)-dependent methylenetetrahydromethanopterin dehydrogenase n=1 Tax=Planctomicrobium sp. SH527 TaxID=3448123 RepID=UPI003F5C2B08